MKLHALNFTGARDLELADLMLRTLHKYCPYLGTTYSRNMDNVNNKQWGNGAGWEASMLKIDSLQKLAPSVDANDLLLSVDSDVVFTNSDVFEWLVDKGEFGIMGIMQAQDHAMTDLGKLMNMSGCSIYLRGWVLHKIAELGPVQLDEIRSRFKAWNVCENEDIVISYLAQMFGAKPCPIPEVMYNGDLDSELLEGIRPKSFYHLNYAPTTFLNEPVTGKWDIPRVIKQKGINL